MTGHFQNFTVSRLWQRTHTGAARLIDLSLVLSCLGQAFTPTPMFFAFVVFALLSIGAFTWDRRGLLVRCLAFIGGTISLEWLAVWQWRIRLQELMELAWLSAILFAVFLMAWDRSNALRRLELLTTKKDADVQNLQALQDLGRQLLGAGDLKATLELVLDRSLDITGFDLGVIRIRSDKGRAFDVSATRGFTSVSNGHWFGPTEQRSDRWRSTRRAMASGRIQVIQDVKRSGRLRLLDGEDVETGVAIPIAGGEQMAGAIILGSRTPRTLQLSERRLLEAIATELGLAIQKVRLYEETHQAFAELEATEERRAQLATIMEATPDVVVVADAQKRWTYANRAAGAMLGIGPEQAVLQLSIDDHRPEWARRRLNEEALPAASTNGSWAGETAYLTTGGREIPVLEVVVAHKSADGRVESFSLLARDISEQKQAEEALAKSEASFRLLFVDNPQPMMVYDRATLKLLEVNAAAVAHYGYEREELVGMSVVALSLPEDVERVRKVVSTDESTLRRTPHTRHRLKDGRIIDVSIVAHRLQFAGHDAVLLVVDDITGRERAQQALAESESELRALFMAMPDIVLVLDKDGRYRRIAPTSSVSVTRPAEEALGKTIHEVLSADEAGTMQRYINEALKTKQAINVEYKVERNGRELWLEGRVSPISADSVFWVARDVNARKEMEAALRSSEASFRLLFLDNPLPMWVYDPESLQVLEVNDAAVGHYGYAREQFLAMRHCELDAPAPDERSMAAGSSRTSREINPGARHRLKDGRIIDVDVSTHPLTFGGRDAVLVVAQDVTQRREAAEGLAQLAAIVESTSDAIMGVDLDGRITDWNTGAEKVYGYSAAEAIGQPVAMLAPLKRRASTERTVDSIRRGARYDQLCSPARRKDGQIIHVALTVAGIRNDAGNVIAISAIARDITRSKQAAEEIKESNRRLEETLIDLRGAQQQMIQQERLRALGRMASGVAHDFNNALSPILGFSELLLARPEQLQQKELVRQYLELMNTGAKDAAAVVGRLREFYRFREQDDVAVKVDLDEVIREAIALTQPKWKDQALAGGTMIGLEADLQHRLPVRGSPSELREMLTNLVFNAVDAMPEGGVISIRTRRNDRRVVLEVSDTGVGMDETVRRRCLEPFFSTKGARGSGLGLSMVHGIVTRHGGEVDVESEPGQGTTIRVSLPIAQNNALESVSSEAVDDQDRPRRILVVDDEPLVRRMLVDYLALDGHTVVEAANGVDAVEKFEAEQFDAVITDRAMPEMNGDQLAIELRKRRPEVPVILLTGFGDMMEAGGECPTGIDVIVSKPASVANVRRALMDAQLRRSAALSGQNRSSAA